MNTRLPRWLGFAAMLFIGVAIGVMCFGGSPPETQVTAVPGEVWTCSMHPQTQQPEPGSCPLCGMDLIPVSPGKSRGSNANQVVLSERARALAKLRTTEVTRQPGASAEVRLLGRIEPDETTRKNVTTWVGGRIDRLHVNTTGERVRKGQVIATIYSPEVYGAHQDLLTAQAQVKRLTGGSQIASKAARAALQAANDRLALLGVSDAQLATMAKAKKPTRGLSIRSPFSGTVIERVATEGAYVQTGSPLYRIADLDRLWVQLDAYESDLQRLGIGQTVTLTLEGVEDTLEGQVSFIDPTLDRQRRTARVRVAIPNTDARLRTGMFVEAVVSAPTGDQAGSPLVIPDTAPLFTGKRSIVYVETSAETGLAYTPRTVRLGPKLGSFYPVVAGLSAGERVVSRGAFAIDADLQIQGGSSMMASDDADTSGLWAAVVEITPAQRSRLAPVLRGYLTVQRALAEDDVTTAAEAARELEGVVTTIEFEGDAKRPWNELVDNIRTHAQQVGESTDLESARGGFEPLSAGIAGLLRTFGNPLDAQVQLAHCPMANSNQGAIWIQQGPTVDNAYFGAMMRTCGDIQSEVAPGGFLPGEKRVTPNHAGHNH